MTRECHVRFCESAEVRSLRATHLVVGFEHEDDARRFLDAMRERLEEFALSLHPDKTRLIEFGRFAAVRPRRRGLGKPETFDFLGFTFICGKSRRGYFLLMRKSRRDRMRAKLQAIKAGTAAAHASADPRPGKMAGAGRQRLVQLPRRADQQSRALRLTLLRHQPLAAKLGEFS